MVLPRAEVCALKFSLGNRLLGHTSPFSSKQDCTLHTHIIILDRISCSPNCPQTPFLHQDGPDHLILLPSPPTHQGYRCVPPCPVYALCFEMGLAEDPPASATDGSACAPQTKLRASHMISILPLSYMPTFSISVGQV